MNILSVLFTAVADGYGLHWKAWKYGSANTSNIHIPTLPEIYILSMIITTVVTVVTLAYADRIDS